MFNIGIFEIACIAIAALVFIGPSKLPEFAKEAGKLFVKFRKFTAEARSTVDSVLREAEREIILENHRKVNEQMIDANPDAEPVAVDDEPAAVDDSGVNRSNNEPNNKAESQATAEVDSSPKGPENSPKNSKDIT